MAKMKKVQPQMERIKERFADDPQKQQQAMMELYRTEKVNPVAGCLPMLLIIPVFFSLYKVIFVTLELRHAPFYGWIHDLSAPDPTSLVNLFGLLPFNPHAVLPSFLGFLSIGIWPILMGITQWFQTKLNPAPADPIQARMFAFMPLIFTFMFATFPAGLVIYYTWNNLLSVAQQYYIMKRQGADVHLIDNLKPPAWLKNLFGNERGTRRRGFGRDRAKAFRGLVRFHLGRVVGRQSAAGKAAGDRFRRALERGQVEPDQCAHRPQDAGTRVEHAGPHETDQFLRSRRPGRARRPARLRLCEGVQEPGRGMAEHDLRVPAGPRESRPRVRAGGFAPRRDGHRPRGVYPCSIRRRSPMRWR